MEGDGELMKMLMRAEPPDESIQGPMDESVLVQSGVYPQTGMAFGSGSYAGMQQQFTGISSQQQQQQQCSSGYPSMNPGQMIPRSPNNGMMQPDMDLMLQQQQQYQPQQQQQPLQSAYGNGNYQGYNGSYQGPRTVSPQTHSQAMSPYQGGFPPDSGYASGGVSGQTMGDFGPQASPSQPMGMPGPASLSLAAMSNRQQYYADGYGMSQPVSPVRKQVSQGGGFLQPSGMPYSQQVPYQPGPYPKRPSSSPVPSQMQGFSSASSSSYTPRSTTGMQLPNMPYTSPTNPYQPPCSPGRRSSSTSPVPQQDAGMYNRPQEHFPQPRSPYGTSQGHFQQHQQQPTHSSCMFVQPSVTPSQSHYQSQQLMTASKAGGLTQRRASYPGHQNAVKMPSPPPKRSPPTKVPSPSATSPDLTRIGQLGFEGRSSQKPFAAKQKASSPPSSDPSSVTSEPATTVSNAVQCSFKKKSTSAKKRSETLKANPRQRRSASDAISPCVSPSVAKNEPLCPGGHKNEAEETIEKEGSDKADTKSKEIDVNESNESKSVSRQELGQAEKRLQSLRDSKEESLSDFDKEVGNECKGDEIKAEKLAAVKTTSVAQQSIDNSETERKEVEESATSLAESESCARSPVKEVEKEGTSHENPKFSSDDKEENFSERKEPSEGKDVDCKRESNKEVEKTGNKNEELSFTPMTDSKIGDTSRKSHGTIEADDQTRTTGLEADKRSERCEKLDDQSKENGKTSQTNDDETGKVSSVEGAAIACETEKIGSGVEDACAEEVDEEAGAEIEDNVNTSAKKSEEGGEMKEIGSEGTRITEKPEVYGKTDELQMISEKSSATAEKSHSNENVDGTQDPKVHSIKDRQATPSLRCEERLSSDDDDRLNEKTPANEKTQESDSEGGHVVESRTLGIQTVQQHTATTRTTKHQVTPIKATIIAKGTSSQNNQQVMVAKTTNGKMYLIQGNILVPVQKLSTDSSKQNPQVIIVNPVTSGSGSNPATKGGNTTVVTKDRNDGKTGNCQSSSRNKTSNVSDKGISGITTMPDTEKCDQNIKNPERSPKTKTPVKKDKSPNSKMTKNSPTRSDKGLKTGEKDNQTDRTESPRAKNNPHSTNSNKTAETTTANQASVEGNRQPVPNKTRGRPVGSKDKQKRKPYVHKVKRKREDVEVEQQNTSEPVAKRKFLKTAIAVQEMSSASGPSVACAKRLVEAPTVSVGRPSKKRKISTSSSPAKHVMSTKPRGGVDGDTWVCSFCGRRSGFNLLGDLYGPYKTKFSKEKSMDGSSKEGKLSQKMSSPSRKASSSSDIQTDNESCEVDLWIHRDCGVWSPGVFMIGRTVHGLEQAVESAAQHKCTKCFELGATLACFKRGCNKIFHYACARDSGSSFVEDNFTIFCSIHK